MQFDELKIGARIICGSRRVSAEEIIEFAERYDPQWFHTDPERARGSPWGGLIASGWLTCSIAMAMVVETILAGSSSRGSPGVDEIRWPKPLRADDLVSTVVTVLESSVSRSGGTGIIRWSWEMTNQNDELVLSLLSTSLFDLRTPRDRHK